MTDQPETEPQAASPAPFRPFETDAPAPVAEKRPVTITQHGESRTDAYAWMRADNWQDVLRDPSVLPTDIRAHLEAENTYYADATAGLEPLRAQLFKEMRGRIKEDESSVPMPDGPFAYAVRFRDGGNYPITYRVPRGEGEGSPNVQILFDGDAEAGDSDFFDIGTVAHSPDHEVIAYSVDRLGSEYYDIRLREIASGKEYKETIPSTDGGLVWAKDSASFFYIERDDNQRPKRVKHHIVGQPPESDTLIYEEPDDGFFLSISQSQSGDYLFIESGNSVSSEARFVPLDPAHRFQPTLIAPRAPDELYAVEHHGEHFYIQTNRGGAIDFKIVRTPIAAPGRENWEDWLPHEPGSYVLDFIPYKDRLVRMVRRDALPAIIIATYDRSEELVVGFDEAAYALGMDEGYEFDTDILRFSYSSPTTPSQTFDYNMKSGVRTLLKTQEVPSGHDPASYVTERIMAPGHDGVDIPVTILKRADLAADGTAPLLLYGYGSYGITIPAGFSTSVLSVVDRGAVYAIAHIRGGAAKGRQWYLDGKLSKKTNTFRDFASAAEALQAAGYGRKPADGAPGGTVIYGGSAGGLLVGATVNYAPTLFTGVIGAVPFVDVLNTISDASLPLTPPEWDEWGNPIEDAAAFRTIAAYSPYENIRSDLPYPPIFATGGLADYRVTYWEPAKWIARLRAEAKGGPFFLRMNMDAGHGGSAARFERLKEKAHDFAFALRIFGLDG